MGTSSDIAWAAGPEAVPPLGPTATRKPAGAAAPALLAEARLVERARTDAQAFAELYRLHQPVITAFVRRRLGSGPAAEDAVAETSVAALENLPRFEARGVPFRSWLYRIALSKVARHVRRVRRADVTSLSEEPAATTTEPDDERVRAARIALARLPRRYAEPLSLHYLEGLSVQATAAVLGLAEGTVKARLSRGRARLRSQLERLGEGGSR